MVDQDLRRHLEQLHGELANVGSPDAETERLLEQIRTDIERLRKRKLETESGIEARLADAARHFESSHPNLAAVIRGVGDMLSQSGI